MSSSPFDLLKFPDFPLEGASSSVILDGVRTQLNWKECAPNGWEATTPAGRWEVTANTHDDGSVEYHAKAQLQQEVGEMRFNLFELESLPLEHLLVSRIAMGGCFAWKFPVEKSESFLSYYTLSLTRNGQTLMLTNPLAQPQLANITGTVEGQGVQNLAAGFDVIHYAPREVDFGSLRFRCGDGLQILQQYATENIEVKRDFSKAPECGWNSWDYYRWTITEDEVLENADFIRKDPVLSKHVKRLIVDDGWQYCYGEWEANSLFPSGMKKLAEQLTEMGFIPGLWFAPVIVEPHARIAQMDYDMLGCSEGGQPCLAFECMRRFGFVLDPTVEKSRKYLRELFDRYSAMGYRYFKLDFLRYVLAARRYADPTVSHGDLMRKLMEPIVEGVNGRATILGCNYPFLAGNSFVDAVRVGSDIHSHWENICTNALAIAYRFWSNKKLWLNDPDFALCRSLDTSDDPDLGRLRPLLVFIQPDQPFNATHNEDLVSTRINEQEVLLSVALMSGGAINLSDKMTRLNADGLELARRVVSAESGMAAIPLDLFRSRLPQYWLQQLPSGGRRLLVVNFADTTATLPINWKEWVGCLPAQVTDFWHGNATAAPEAVELAPHSCRLYQF